MNSTFTGRTVPLHYDSIIISSHTPNGRLPVSRKQTSSSLAHGEFLAVSRIVGEHCVWRSSCDSISQAELIFWL